LTHSNVKKVSKENSEDRNYSNLFYISQIQDRHYKLLAAPLPLLQGSCGCDGNSGSDELLALISSFRLKLISEIILRVD